MTEMEFAANAPDIVDAHLNYLGRVLDYVQGRIPDPQASAHTQCVLGRWYYESAAHDPRYKDHPRYSELGEWHTAFHQACEAAVKFHRLGQGALVEEEVAKARELSIKICEGLIEILGL